MPIDSDTRQTIKDSIISLLDYCRKNDWAGYDPYDALNSRIFKALPFLNFRLFRLGLTQMLKRSPVNFRPLLLVPKTQNPKAIALFLMAFLKLSKLGLLNQKDLIETMVEMLITLRSPDTPYWCWGYSFPWQGRTILVPRAAPNLVCTVFVADALLDAYDVGREPSCLEMARSAVEYILNELYWTEGDSVGCFSYPLPNLKNKVHNANFLGAALLARVYSYTGDEKFLSPALRAARYSASLQRGDGTWCYGEHPTQGWVDNFHTGYNLCALKAIDRYTGAEEFEPYILKGFKFYRENFFRDDGAPKYFHNRTYPIDIHSVAQSIITLLTFKDLDENNVGFAYDVFKWAMAKMLDRHGYYYYQKTPYYTIKIPYMRWAQAWMLLALSTLLEEGGLGGQGKND